MDYKCNGDNYAVCSKEKEKDCCNKPRQVLLECGCNHQDAIFEIYNEYVKEHQTFDLDRLTIDTNDLCRPLVKIDFSSLVVVDAEDKNGEFEVELLFELIRNCNGQKETLQSWIYKNSFELDQCNKDFEIETSVPFTVTFCDRPCPGCCDYKMIVKGKDFKGRFDALRVVKPNLSAIAQGQCVN